MKKAAILLSLALVAGTVGAQVIFEDDFSSYSGSINGANWNPKWAAGTDQQNLLMAYDGILEFDTTIAQRNYHCPSKTGFTVGTNDVYIITDARYVYEGGGNITANLNKGAFGLYFSQTDLWYSGPDKSSPMCNRGAAVGHNRIDGSGVDGWNTHSSLGVNTANNETSNWFKVVSRLVSSNSTIWVQALVYDVDDTYLESPVSTGVISDSGVADGTTIYAGYSPGYNNVGNTNIASFSKFTAVHYDNFYVGSKPEFGTPAPFSVDNLQLRGGAAKMVFGGTTTKGAITNHPDFTLSATYYAPAIGEPLDIPLRWDGFDLDGDGTNDYVDFTLRAVGAVEKAGLLGNGFGDGYTFNATNEAVTFTVTDITLSDGTRGSVTFDGFTGGATMGADWGDKTYEFYADINGLTVGGQETNNSVKTWHTGHDVFTNETMVVDNIVLYSNEYTGSLWVREFDLDFTWSGYEPPEPPKTLTINDLYTRPDTNQFVYGGSYEGVIELQPDAPVMQGAQYANPIEIPIRWSNLNLDGEGGTDDWIDFTLRAVPAAEASAVWQNAGFGDGWNINTNGEGLTFTVADVSVGSNTAGSVKFDGFTSAAVLVSDYSDPKSWDVSIDINGITISSVVTNQGGSGNTTMKVAENAFTNQTLLVDNPVIPDPSDEFYGEIVVRHLDMMFTWTSEEAPAGGYDLFAWEYELSGVKTDDKDGDGLNDWGEYVFGGHPDGGEPVWGMQPVLDPATGDYTFYLVGDNSVVAHVVTTDNLIHGTWTTNHTETVILTDGVVVPYTDDTLGTSATKKFIKLLVE
ncbi:hypothetical protein PDESU_06058 [Pontiella desulfatans]|uniref:Uncharacterized protein n=1 Tax=Pontiella desulfatans TaxID=2750659 RepID=A0A6C2UBB4_PONDE|nr:hypothetical protein [Pontiella desulfatans]VGO17462.1 hypothetical protein PDESU_06058 [Pontiella desulfatans]